MHTGLDRGAMLNSSTVLAIDVTPTHGARLTLQLLPKVQSCALQARVIVVQCQRDGHSVSLERTPGRGRPRNVHLKSPFVKVNSERKVV
jgi:hypothetical protein